MIAKVIIAALQARRLLASAVSLLKYFVQPQPGDSQGLYQKGERLLRSPWTRFVPQGESASGLNAGRWAKVVAWQLFALVKAWRGSAKPPVKYFEHLMVAFHPSDCPRLGASDSERGARAEQIIREVLDLVGLDKHPCAVVVHGDTEHVHGHVMVGTVGYHGGIWNPGKRIYRELEKAMEAKEKEHGLHRVKYRIACVNEPGGLSRRPERMAPSPNEVRKRKKTGEPSARERLQTIVEEAMQASDDFFEFLERIEHGGAQLVPYQFEKGRIGCAFRIDGVTLSGTDLGRGYTWPKVAARTRFDKGNPGHRQALSARVAKERVREKSTSLTILPKKFGVPLEEPSALTKLRGEEKEGHTQYRFRPSGRAVVVRGHATRIEVGPYSPDAVQAAFALARQRGWVEVSMHGHEEALVRANLVIAGRDEVNKSAVRARL